MKKAIKIFGNICVLVTLFFIIQAVMNMDFDYRSILQTKKIICIAILVIVYSIALSFNVVPWKIICEFLSEKKLKIADVYAVYAKSNLYKYLPGNIFQFVGRQTLAVDYKIEHGTVAVSTIFDIIVLFFTGLIISIIFLGNYAFEQLFLYGYNIISRFFIVLVVFFIILFSVVFVLRKSIIKIFNKYKTIVNKKFVAKLFKCFIFYCVFFAFYSAIYLVLIHIVFDVELSLKAIFTLTGASVFSWVMGFVVFGAPGGLGIREVVMTAVSVGFLDSDTIIVSMVLLRFITILSDIFMFIESVIFKFAVRKKCL